mgnify:CR=1 FL=1
MSRIASPFTEMHSLKAVDLILANLQEAVATRSLESLEQLSIASVSASMAFSNAGLSSRMWVLEVDRGGCVVDG